MSDTEIAIPYTSAQVDDQDEDSQSDISASATETSSLVTVRAGCCSFNPVSRTGKRWHQMQMMTLPFIPIAALIIQNCLLMASVVSHQGEMTMLSRQVDGTVELGMLLTALQLERAEVAYYIFSNGTKLRSTNQENYRPSNIRLALPSRTSLEETFRRTDLILDKVHQWPNFTTGNQDLLGSKLRFQIRLEDLRNGVNDADDSVGSKMTWYNYITFFVMEAIVSNIKDANISSVWKLLVAYKDMIRAVEYFGIVMIEGLTFFGSGSLERERFISFVVHDVLAWKSLNQTKDFVSSVREQVEDFYTKYEEFKNITEWRQLILGNVAQLSDLKVADDYYYVMVRFTDELRDIQWQLLDMIQSYMQAEAGSADSQVTVSIVLLVMVLFISPVIIFLVRHATYTIQVFAATLTTKAAELKREKRRCDRLIFQMLPKPVAVQLKKKRSVPAESYKSVSVYFSDIVGFTTLCSSSEPLQVVTLLNKLYNMFDSRIGNYDVYKVETIGDAYMVVSGVPHSNGMRHAAELCNMALDLIEGAKEFEIPHRPDKDLLIRAGINSGPCVAGVVGTKMPRYCLFGDTVNVASRMETTGEAMKVHLSQATKEILDQVGGYTCEFRGYQEVKGKGSLPTFWLMSGPPLGSSRGVRIPLSTQQ
ncbi:uncharacterized protein LOC126981318 [Eriocheir sinensis]|uniref:uncharacterized protein LOC126981318 n=1 Tax=Eriocheir sinensis TaxID=95602 RepID=UPI0021C89965|nr:uncharacterized protein LOC126981318 [Eriocheir sinensis]